MKKKYEKRYEKKSNILKISNEAYVQKKEVVTSFFLDTNYVPITSKQAAVMLNIPSEEKEILEKILMELESDGILYIDDSKRYVPLSRRSDLVACKYQAKSEKFGFGLLADSEDIYIASHLAAGAMGGDDVLVKIIKQSAGTKSKEGKVEKVLKRNTSKVIGRFIKSQNFGFVEPIDSKIKDIYIPKKSADTIKDGQVVEVEITKYATGTSKTEGKILSIIGDKDTTDIEVKALYKSYGLDVLEKVAPFVEKELLTIPDIVSEQEKMGRENRVNQRVYTIDGEDAKDLDDGVFVSKKEDGTYVLSVYIADVSHYVTEGSAIDAEAVSRGTSIYIPGSVIPMLPRKLSNGICSLNEGVERLSLAIDITYDKEGNVLDSQIFKAVIMVTKRMSYDAVYKVITHTDDAILEEYRPYEADILVMKELAEILNAKRKENGSINFDIPDTKIILDENGQVTGLEPYHKTIANDMIEEFMLAANMEVAKTFFFLEFPFIYRIHEKPDEDKLNELNVILYNYKKKIKGIKNIQPKTLSRLLDEFESEEEKKVISTCMLRTLKLAKYSDECVGHFGLAAKYYCHFTSPIRRYPDLFIHRVISDYIESNYVIPEERYSLYTTQAPQYAMSSSDTEKQATLIERDFDDLYKVMYMERFVGDTFEATISSVTSFGMFVKLENTAEGLVPFDGMPDDDYYQFDESKKLLIGRRKGNIYKMGDKVKVELSRCDVKAKQIDFIIVS